MAGTIEMFRRSVEEFGRRVLMISDADLGRPTPCTDWDVRALLHHLVYEELWAPPLLGGATIAEVGDRFEGEILGAEYHSAWKEASAGALAAATAEALDRTVHLSFGDFPGRDYLGQLTADHVIHAWDLARALGADETLPPDLVAHVHDFLAPQAAQWQDAGVFAAPVEVPADAGLQTRLLALTGRSYR
ncbi:MAG TPA: TIGR03086 family metal-binding protein [Acidimicrobiia bacterium]|nr:TIGR03086 family metal-binding protein [Acidimicrobiia bacterium]